MARYPITDLANDINNYCIKFEYFGAYGLLKETKELWKNINNRNLLCTDAQIMLEKSKLI